MSDFIKGMDQFRPKYRPSEPVSKGILHNQKGFPLLDDNGKPMVNREENRKKFKSLLPQDETIPSVESFVSDGFTLDADGNLVTVSNAVPEGHVMADAMNTTIENIHATENGLRKWSVDELKQVPQGVLLEAATQFLSHEQIMGKLMSKFGKQPTSAAVYRTIEFMNATCSPLRNLFDDDDDDFWDDNPNKPSKKMTDEEIATEQINTMVSEMNQLMFVSKARLIMNDYPESVSISVQMVPSVQDGEEEVALQAFENLILEYKPKDLIELEVSITNKVVY